MDYPNIEQRRKTMKKWRAEHREQCNKYKKTPNQLRYRKEYNKKYREEHREQLLKSKKDYYQKNKGHLREKNKEWRKNNVGRIREEHLKYLYNITPEDFNALAVKQRHSCGICGSLIRGRGNANIDHCHKTGKIRGILCPKCNKGLGFFKDDPKLLQLALNYILKNKGR